MSESGINSTFFEFDSEFNLESLKYHVNVPSILNHAILKNQAKEKIIFIWNIVNYSDGFEVNRNFKNIAFKLKNPPSWTNSGPCSESRNRL